MIAPRKFLGVCALTAGLLVGFNALVHWSARGSLPRKLRQRIAAGSDIQVTAVGNSVVEAGFNPTEFSQNWRGDGPSPKAFNAGLGSTSQVEHYLVARQVLSHQTQSKRIIYGFFDLMLTEDLKVRLSDFYGNRCLSFIYEPDLAARFITESGWERTIFPYLARVPIYVERGTLWAKVEQQRRRFGELGLTARASNQFGRVEDFSALEIPAAAEFRSLCRKSVLQHRPICPPIDLFFREAAAQNAQIYVVAMPMRLKHRDQTYDSPEWAEYWKYLATQLAPYHAILIPAGDWIPDDQFADPVHLGPSGAVQFSRRLAVTISELERQSRPISSPKSG